MLSVTVSVTVCVTVGVTVNHYRPMVCGRNVGIFSLFELISFKPYPILSSLADLDLIWRSQHCWKSKTEICVFSANSGNRNAESGIFLVLSSLLIEFKL